MLLVFMSKHFLLLLQKMFILFMKMEENGGNNNAHSKTDQTRPANQFDIHSLFFIFSIVYKIIVFVVVFLIFSLNSRPFSREVLSLVRLLLMMSCAVCAVLLRTDNERNWFYYIVWHAKISWVRCNELRICLV